MIDASLAPKTQREVNIDVLTRLDRIERKVDATNGRVRDLERWKWGLGGGIAVLTVIVVPIFLRLVG